MSVSYFSVGVLAGQGAELAQAFGTLTCPGNLGPALPVFGRSAVCSANVERNIVDPHFARFPTCE